VSAWSSYEEAVALVPDAPASDLRLPIPALISGAGEQGARRFLSL
jgi:hypothetical protein